ncbi:MAG: ATP-binding protein [Nitrospirota bacterium]|nr:ATP-binding protein [Nitrospirota bacterium]
MKNHLSELEHLYQALVQFGQRHDISSTVMDEMNLALEEIFTNIISYAFSNEAEHTIILRLSIDDDQLLAEVEDDGKPFNPLNAQDPDIGLSLEDRPIGGLGILLAKNMVNHIDYTHCDGKNLVRLRKFIRD